MDKLGHKVDVNRSTADGLQIPLVVGPVRSIDNNSFNAVDVVFHSNVLKCCANEKYFRAQIVELAMQWILEETNVKFEKRKWNDEGAVYKGGLGDNKDIPVLFHVNDDNATLDRSNKGNRSMNENQNPSGITTESILSEIHKNNQRSTDSVSINPTITSQKPGIQIGDTEKPSIAENVKNSNESKIEEVGAASKTAVALEGKSEKTNENKNVKPLSRLELEQLEDLLEKTDPEFAAGSTNKGYAKATEVNCSTIIKIS